MKYQTAADLISRREQDREIAWDERVNRLRSDAVKDYLWKNYDTQLWNWEFALAVQYFKLLQQQTRMINKMFAELGVTTGVQAVVNSAIERETMEVWTKYVPELYMSLTWDFAYTTVEQLLPDLNEEDEKASDVSDDNMVFPPSVQYRIIQQARRRLPRKEVIENGFHPRRGRGLNIPVDKTKYNQQATKFVRERINTYYPEMSNTMKKNLNLALRRGNDQALLKGLTGKARDDFIRKEVAKSVGKKNLGRALNIARTESLVLANWSQEQTVKQLDIITTKEWVTERDGKVRDAHVILDGVEVEETEVFSTMGYNLKYPGDSSKGAPASLVCNCRCMLVRHRKKV